MKILIPRDKKIQRMPLIFWVSIFFLTASILCTVSWWRGVIPFLQIGSDSGNIASFVAAYMNIELFEGDMVLNEINNFRHYISLILPLIYLFQFLTGDLGTATLLILPFVHFIQALGFFVLGRVLFKNNYIAFLLGCLAFAKVDLTIDHWGTYVDANPRFLFAACLPWLFTMCFCFGKSNQAWCWIMSLHGLAFYIHPVSGPSVAFASLFVLFFTFGKSFPLKERFYWATASGLLFLFLCVPFLINYFYSREYGVSVDLNNTLELQKLIIGSYFFNAWEYIKLATSNWTVNLLLPIWGVSGLFLTWFFEPSSREKIIFFVIWVFGLLIASLGITLIEQSFSRYFRVMPVEIDLIRNVRYVVPVLIIFGLWGSYSIAKKILNRSRNIILFTSIIAMSWLIFNKPGSVPVRATINCFISGKILCPPKEWAQQNKIIDFLKNKVPPKSKVLPALGREEGLTMGLAVRYHSQKPVVFSYKDGGFLSYTSNSKVALWQKIALRLDALHANKNINGIIQLGEELKASIVITDFHVPDFLPPTNWRRRLLVGSYVIFVKETGVSW